eukprot:356690-Chlamydomonas_euryale.AAC.4
MASVYSSTLVHDVGLVSRFLLARLRTHGTRLAFACRMCCAWRACVRLPHAAHGMSERMGMPSWYGVCRHAQTATFHTSDPASRMDLLLLRFFRYP